ncbi:hypothetical protein K4K57_002185 [Colletotrichum sp. SAR 10_99]|nr:hypothetical protein K4K57_002185 [Colletotrichum sp. SAR 10_99]
MNPFLNISPGPLPVLSGSASLGWLVLCGDDNAIGVLESRILPDGKSKPNRANAKRGPGFDNVSRAGCTQQQVNKSAFVRLKSNKSVKGDRDGLIVRTDVWGLGERLRMQVSKQVNGGRACLQRSKVPVEACNIRHTEISRRIQVAEDVEKQR